MKYHNSSSESINFRKNGIWFTVKPGETVDSEEIKYPPVGLNQIIQMVKDDPKKEEPKKTDSKKEEPKKKKGKWLQL